MKYLKLIVLILIVSSCNSSRLDVNVSSIDVDLKLHRFDKVLFEGSSYEVAQTLNELYGDHREFIDLYTEDILQIGNVENDSFNIFLESFVKDTVIAQVADSVLVNFNDLQKIEEDLANGFKHYKFYFPAKVIPAVYTYVSGFNQSLVVTEDLIGVNLDKYLGEECVFYQYLGIPQFKIANMYPGKIVPDVFHAWGLTEYPNLDSIGNLLSNMIYQGKLMYFTEAMNPQMPDSVVIGYSSEKLKWCKKNEGMMWAYMVDNKLIYTLDRLDMMKFITDGPFTSTFSNNSPGRTGVWLGWQIVRSFMNNHEEISLEQLMNINDAQLILNQSRYFPD